MLRPLHIRLGESRQSTLADNRAPLGCKFRIQAGVATASVTRPASSASHTASHNQRAGTLVLAALVYHPAMSLTFAWTWSLASTLADYQSGKPNESSLRAGAALTRQATPPA